MNYDTLIPNLDGKFFNYFAMLKKTSYNFLCVYLSYIKYVNGRRTGLVTFCVETAFYNGLLKERYRGDRNDRETRKKT